MTFKIKMLTAVAVLSLPVAVAAQDQTSPPASQETPMQQPVESPTPPVEPSMQTPDPAIQTPDPSASQPPASTMPDPSASQPSTTPPASAGTVTQATAADIQAGAPVRDQAGAPVGTIESVSAEGAVVSTGTVRAQLPISSFGKDNQGLVIAMTKIQLEAAAGQRSPG